MGGAQRNFLVLGVRFFVDNLLVVVGFAGVGLPLNHRVYC